jgi:glycosyltransferase involved in cell wall biosynthesis
MSWGLSAIGRRESASAVLVAAGRRIRQPRLRADFLSEVATSLGEAATQELSRGHEPRGLVAAYSAELACADERYRSGDLLGAADSLSKATELAFHRVLHIDRLSSPLEVDPRGFTEPLRQSITARAVAAARGRKAPAAPAPVGRPLRLLIVVRGNANFLPLVRSYYEGHPEVELRFLDLLDDPAITSVLSLKRMLQFSAGGLPEYGERVEEVLRPYLDWADTVFVEWCTAAAAFLTLVDPGTTRVVVRLHRFEAYTYWPHRVDFSRVDDLIFVGDHIRELMTQALPRLHDADAPRLHVIANAMELTDFQRPKSAEARFTLGLIGIGQIAKDPRWALEVLRGLRAQDPRYRMLVLGNGLDPERSAASRHYHDQLERDFAELEPSGAVRRLGHQNDIPASLTEIGVVLSSSVREGVPCTIMEGAASGAVPVIRDWPGYAALPHGARALYPRDWVVGSPQEAVARIISTTATEDAWRKTGQAAAELVISTWDWAVVQHDFDRLLLPSRPAEAGEAPR